ncbi:MAG: thiamine phosphate synthase [Chloroflexi bacterium]|nr:thiamine phosphate synthase [Chloroflexota bacterium]
MNAGVKSLPPQPILCLITQRSHARERTLPALIESAVDGGVNMVQLRERDLSREDLLALAHQARKAIQGRALLLVNQQVEVALACGADGVQLGEEAMSVESVREQVGDLLLIGRSVHSVESAQEAEKRGADFLIVGTVFPTASKPGVAPAGLELLSHIAGAVTIPFLAIGGVTRDNVAQVMEHGSNGAAVISAILGAADPRQAARDIIEEMRQASIDARNIGVKIRG